MFVTGVTGDKGVTADKGVTGVTGVTGVCYRYNTKLSPGGRR